MSARGVDPDPVRRVAVVTGTRAEFGLLTPVMRAVEAHPGLELCTIVSGTHLLGPTFSRNEVHRLFRVDAEVPMQREGETGRLADAAALGRGVEGMARALAELTPDWLIVLGDRVEALAGAAAGSVAGVCVGHVHAGDRAEGIADEAMRHAITKLAHAHFAATEGSARRIERMGEEGWRIHVVGSPAVDGLEELGALGEGAFEELGSPRAVFLMHPIGRSAREEEREASGILGAMMDRFGERVVCVHPNFDAGREGIVEAIEVAARRFGFLVREHLERGVFVGLLRRLASGGGVMVGNSSAGLIEAAALGLPVVDVGARQGGRERAGNVVHAEGASGVGEAIEEALGMDRGRITHPYGDGRSGERIAGVIAGTGEVARLLRKRCVY